MEMVLEVVQSLEVQSSETRVCAQKVPQEIYLNSRYIHDCQVIIHTSCSGLHKDN